MADEFSSEQKTKIQQVAAGVVLTSLIRALEEKSPGLHARVKHLVFTNIALSDDTLPGAKDVHALIREEVESILDISSF